MAATVGGSMIGWMGETRRDYAFFFLNFNLVGDARFNSFIRLNG